MNENPIANSTSHSPADGSPSSESSSYRTYYVLKKAAREEDKLIQGPFLLEEAKDRIADEAKFIALSFLEDELEEKEAEWEDLEIRFPERNWDQDSLWTDEDSFDDPIDPETGLDISCDAYDLLQQIHSLKEQLENDPNFFEDVEGAGFTLVWSETGAELTIEDHFSSEQQDRVITWTLLEEGSFLSNDPKIPQKTQEQHSSANAHRTRNFTETLLFQRFKQGWDQNRPSGSHSDSDFCPEQDNPFVEGEPTEVFQKISDQIQIQIARLILSLATQCREFHAGDSDYEDDTYCLYSAALSLFNSAFIVMTDLISQGVLSEEAIDAVAIVFSYLLNADWETVRDLITYVRDNYGDWKLLDL